MWNMTEKLKNYLGWVLIISILLVAFSAWRYVSAYARSIQPASFRSFSASGEGKVVVVPDVAKFTFSVITEGDTDISKLQTSNTEKVNKAIKFLKDQGLDEKDIKTESYNLSPRYETANCGFRPDGFNQTCPPPEIVGYSISQTVSVKVRQDNFSKIGEALSGVIKQGANSVSQLDFTIDDPVTAENEARAQAIAEAKVKAKSIAKAAGFSLGELLGIDEGGMDYPMTKIYSMEASRDLGMAAAPAPSIQPGSQEVRVSVTLRYEIE